MNRSESIRLLEEQSRIIEMLHSTVFKQLSKWNADMLNDCQISANHRLQTVIIEKKMNLLKQMMNDIKTELNELKNNNSAKNEKKEDCTENKIKAKPVRLKAARTSIKTIELVKEEKPVTKPILRLDMNNKPSENIYFGAGWYSSQDGFRWAGKDSKNPVLYFVVNPNKAYKLVMKMFVPEAIAGKPIAIIANEKEIEEMTIKKQSRFTKSVAIPSDTIPTSRLKIEIKSSIWNTKDYDKTLGDRPLSLAFDYIELYCLE